MQGSAVAREQARRSPQWLIDGGLVVLVVGARLVQYSVNDDHHPPVGLALGTLITLVATLPLVMRRRFPRGVFVAIALGECALRILDLHAVPIALLIALYSVAFYCPMRESLVALASAAAGALVAVDEAGFAFDSAVLLGMAWALGGLQNARKRYEAEVKWSSKLVDREREAEAQLTVSRERTRIAHEIHDVVAHGVGVMIMQAAGARRSLRGDLARAERAMVDVEQTGRRSLAEIRRLLGLLDTHDEPELAPQPGLGRLDDLLEDFRRADLPVDLIVDGHRRELPQGVDLSAFRIVQEGLTNVLKHAGHVPVEVTLRYRDDRLGVEVSNRGNGRIVQPPESSPGRGLIGMRERAALLGGTFRAAPQPDGGFRVECELPVNGA